MNRAAHIARLQDEHKEIEDILHDAYVHHLPEEELKKQKLKKLRLRDQIVKLEKKEPQIA